MLARRGYCLSETSPKCVFYYFFIIFLAKKKKKKEKAWKALSGDRYLEVGRERKGGRGWGAVGGGQDQKYLMPTVALGNPPF